MADPELIFDMSEERYEALAKTHKVITFALQILGAVFVGFLTLAVLSIGGLK